MTLMCIMATAHKQSSRVSMTRQRCFSSLSISVSLLDYHCTTVQLSTRAGTPKAASIISSLTVHDWWPFATDDSDRDCPNCLPQSAAERTNSRGSSRQGGNSTAVAQRPPAASVPDLDDFEFYPGTGADDVMEMNVVNAPLIPLWK